MCAGRRWREPDGRLDASSAVLADEHVVERDRDGHQHQQRHAHHDERLIGHEAPQLRRLAHSDHVVVASLVLVAHVRHVAGQLLGVAQLAHHLARVVLQANGGGLGGGGGDALICYRVWRVVDAREYDDEVDLGPVGATVVAAAVRVDLLEAGERVALDEQHDAQLALELGHDVALTATELLGRYVHHEHKRAVVLVVVVIVGGGLRWRCGRCGCACCGCGERRVAVSAGEVSAALAIVA